MDARLPRAFAEQWGLASPEAAEVEIYSGLQRVSRNVARKVRPFASYTIADLEQEAFGFGLQGLAGYDVTRPLAGFIAVHMKNRLLNLKRDKFFRAGAPCGCCDPFHPPPEPCKKWLLWNRTNFAKQFLATAHGSDKPHDPAERLKDGDRDLAKEIDEFVVGAFDHHTRADYARLKAGLTLPGPRFEAVVGPIRDKFGADYAP